MGRGGLQLSRARHQDFFILINFYGKPQPQYFHRSSVQPSACVDMETGYRHTMDNIGHELLRRKLSRHRIGCMYLQVCWGRVDGVVATTLSSGPERVNWLAKLARPLVHHVKPHRLHDTLLGTLPKETNDK